MLIEGKNVSLEAVRSQMWVEIWKFPFLLPILVPQRRQNRGYRRKDLISTHVGLLTEPLRGV